MKDILKVMRFDFLTASPLGLTIIGAVAAVCTLGALFFSPVIACYMTFGAMGLIIPLQGAADKSGFNKLYGILPVGRKNITRARFLYLFTVLFVSELADGLIMFIAIRLKLYRLLPNQNSETMQMVKESFSDGKLALVAAVGMFAVICLFFGYMEMMGQIHGRENEMKIVMATLAVVTVIGITLSKLSDMEILPTIKLPSLPSAVPEMLALGAVLNAVLLALCLIFGEITAAILSEREL